MEKKIVVSCIFCLTIGWSAGFISSNKYHAEEIAFKDRYPQFFEFYNNINELYYKDKDDKNVQIELMDGFIKGLDDAYTYFDKPRDIIERSVNNGSSTSDSGFHVSRDRKTRLILVDKVEEGSRAEKMGLQVGDLITDIDDVNVSETGYYDSIEKLLGKDGTKMKLKILRKNKELEIEFTRKRVIEEYETFTFDMPTDDILYCKFDSFENIAPNFQQAVENYVESQTPKKLILDMRENTGGTVSDCVALFDLFADSGNRVKFVYSNSGEEELFETGDGTVYDFDDVVVLVSEKTLSSGEILAAFFHDTGKGTLIGEQTGGKGVFQRSEYQWGGATSAVVAGYYYVNDLPNYNGIGVTPDIFVETDFEKIGTKEDEPLQKAIEILSK